MADQLAGALQENLLTLVAYNDEHCQLVRNAVDPSLFSTFVYRDIIQNIYAYIDQFHKAPKDHLPDLLEDQLAKRDQKAEVLGDILHNIHELSESLNAEYVVGQLEKFIRGQQIKIGIVEATEAVQRGDLDAAQTVLEASLKNTTAVFDAGLTLLDGLRRVHTHQHDRDTILLGVPELDKRELGPGKKELHLFLAPPKRGKCIHSDSLVLLPNGQRKRIAEVVRDRDPQVLALSETTGELVVVDVAEHWANGKKECFRVTTKLGRSIVTTAPHLYLTERGWLPVSELIPNKDRIAVPNYMPQLGTRQEAKRKLRVLGYLLADGCLLDPWSLRWTKFGDQELIGDFKECIVQEFGDRVVDTNQGREHYIVGLGSTRNWLRQLGLMEKHSHEKQVPAFVFQLTDEGIAEFLRGLFSCDSGVYDKKIEFVSANSVFAEQVKHLLLRLGIVSRYRTFATKLNGKKIHGYGSATIIGTQALRRFMERVGFIGQKQAKAIEMLSTMTAVKRPYGTKPLSDRFLYDEVVEVRPVGLHDTYDLSVAVHHNFLANDMVAHNTWWLIHNAKRALMQRLKVCVVTLEMSEDRYAQRLLQNLLSLSRREAEIRIPTFDTDELDRLVGIGHRIEKNRPVLSNKADLAKIEGKLTKLRFHKNILIKAFPTRSLSVNGLKAYLDSLERMHRFIPDVLILDYADLMKVNTNNYRIELGALYAELRGVAVERNLALVTASQANREGARSQLITDTNVAEDYSKIAISDCVMSYNQTKEEKRLGLARIYVTSGRNEEDKFAVLISQAYGLGQFCLESRKIETDYWNVMEASSREAEQEEE